MRKILIVDGHPDPALERLNHALADAYADAVREARCAVRCITVARLEFPLIRSAADFEKGAAPEAIREAQSDLQWADHLVFIFPLWLGDMPALLKGFLEQTFRPGIALGQGPGGLPKPLLRGKSARIIVTMGMPALMYRSFMGTHSVRALERILALAGVRPARELLIGNLFSSNESTHRRWFSAVRAAAAADCRPAGGALRRLSRSAAGIVAGAAAGYAAYASLQWARYGSPSRQGASDMLLDRMMPDYEVCVRHSCTVHAPADAAFDALCDLDFRRLPALVHALFETRARLMGTKYAENAAPEGLVDQLAALGWTLAPESSARELVLVTATQPWQPAPAFRAVPAPEFKDFDEPGYAKIALSLGTRDRGDRCSEVFTETRVQTTDPVSRARFRRYWALVAPGVALIRAALLRRVRVAAESSRAA